jgi:hypothetical protein
MQEFLRNRFVVVVTTGAKLLGHRATDFGVTDIRSVRLRFGLAANIDGAVAHDDGSPVRTNQRATSSKVAAMWMKLDRGADCRTQRRSMGEVDLPMVDERS